MDIAATRKFGIVYFGGIKCGYNAIEGGNSLGSWNEKC
jgi:hypothetical protein